MMGIDGGLMLILALVCMLAVPLLLIGAVYLGIRALGSTRRLGGGHEGRALLDRRLAAGEISVDEYYERESALRSTEPAAPARPRRWR